LINLISPIERAFPRINELVFNLENRLDAHKNAIEDLGHKFMTLKERDGEKEDRLWGLESELRFYINKKEKSGAKK